MSAPLTTAELVAIEERANAASPGEWYVESPLEIEDDGHGISCRVNSAQSVVVWDGLSSEDAEFIAHAREDIPRLVATVKALRALLGVTLDDEEIDERLAERASP